jgi:hypothetical protein
MSNIVAVKTPSGFRKVVYTEINDGGTTSKITVTFIDYVLFMPPALNQLEIN